MNANITTLQDIRENYFLDPSGQDKKSHSAAQFIEGAMNGQAINNTTGDNDASPFMHDLATRFKPVRVFDEKSIGQLHPSGFLPGMLAHMTSTVFNNNTIIREVSPVETDLEHESIAWLLENIGNYSSEIGSGSLVTNGTLANITALMVARERLIADGKWDLSRPATVLTTEMGHYSLNKAARLLAPGGLIRVDTVGVQPDYKMDLVELRSKVASHIKAGNPIMAVIAIAGQTETGIVDDIAEIAEICEKNGIFLHVDGAYGGPFRLSRQGKLFEGIERSSSVTVDPHKYMYAPYNVGAVLFRSALDHALLCASNSDGNEYMFKEGTQSYLGGKRIEGSMGGQGAASTWAVIQTLGKDGLRLLLDHNLDLTDYAFQRIRESNQFLPAFAPELNTLCFYPRAGNHTLTAHQQSAQIDETCKQLEAETGYYLRSTTIPVYDQSTGRFVEKGVYRAVFTHPFTTTKNVDEVMDGLEKIG
jgi:glutamate/tyrosine decarboxylase-like PLP-dependent enzyme